MVEHSLYSFLGYKSYLKAWIHSKPSHGHGERKKFAENTGCHSAYISQVLEHEAHLNLEQGLALSKYLGHGALEERFFLLLIQKDRAGNATLREHFQQQLEEIQSETIALQHALENKETLTLEDQATYYSSWHFAAIHVLLTIPSFQTREAIADRLSIPTLRAAEILDFLCATGLAERDGGHFRHGSMKVFLPDGSPLSTKLHTNWRVLALNTLDQHSENALHFSSIATIKKCELTKVRKIFMRAIEEARSVVRESTGDDTLFCYTLDLFIP